MRLRAAKFQLSELDHFVAWRDVLLHLPCVGTSAEEIAGRDSAQLRFDIELLSLRLRQELCPSSDWYEIFRRHFTRLIN